MRSSNVLPFPFHKTLRCALFLLKMFQVDILETYKNQRKNKIKLTSLTTNAILGRKKNGIEQ
jgi:hypothetical protein